MNSPNSELAQLRAVLTPKSNPELDELRDLLKSDEHLAERLTEVLPTIFNPRDKDNKRLSHSMQTSVLDSLNFASATEPKRVAQVLSPALLPAINHAIGQALLDFRASIDEMMRNYLSPKGLLWRFKAWRSGESFSKIARRNSASFGVEALVYVHKQTKELVYTQYNNSDIELLIRKHDTHFKSECIQLASTATITEVGTQVLSHQIRLQDENIRVYAAHGAWLSMLVLCWGEAPPSFTEQMVSVLHRAHAQNHHELSTRKIGAETMTALAMPSNVLIKLAANVGNGVKANKPIGFLIFAAVVLAALGTYFWQQWQWSTERKDLEQFLAQQPSWVSTQITRDKQVWQVQGMLDQQLTSAKQISDAWPQQHLGGHTLQIRATPYVSLENQAVLQRAVKLLDPPKGISLTLDENGVLKAQGNLKAIDQTWLESAKAKSQHLLGVNSINLKAVQLLAEPVVLNPSTLIEFARASELSAEGQTQLSNWVKQWQALDSKAKPNRIVIASMNSVEGSAQRNQTVRQERFEFIRAQLVQAGVPIERIEHVEDPNTSKTRAVEIRL